MMAEHTSVRAQYEALLIELHSEMRAGRGGEPRANELRDQLAAVWYGLGEDEQAICDELSEDLYAIEGKRASAPLSEGETLTLVMQQLASAFGAGNNRRSLELIRKLTSIDGRSAYVMGRCWEREGLFRAAACFYDFANELEPKVEYEVMALSMLVRAGALDEAAERAQAIEARPVVSGTLLLKVASVLHRIADAAEASQRSSMYNRVTHLVEAVWDDRSVLSALRAEGLVVAGFAYQHLGDNDQAIRSFERAVAVHPSDGALCARGLALLHNDRTRALRDLTDAVRLGTRLDWPYLFAAHHAMETHRFAEAERFCEIGAQLSRQPELRGRLLEWWAIAAAQLGRSPSEVTALFEQATIELPLDVGLQHNVRLYRESLETSRELSPAGWQVPPAELDEAQARESLEARPSLAA
jgi:tetratricopeptide (TPR) repeat protein